MAGLVNSVSPHNVIASVSAQTNVDTKTPVSKYNQLSVREVADTTVHLDKPEKVVSIIKIKIKIRKVFEFFAKLFHINCRHTNSVETNTQDKNSSLPAPLIVPTSVQVWSPRLKTQISIPNKEVDETGHELACLAFVHTDAKLLQGMCVHGYKAKEGLDMVRTIKIVRAKIEVRYRDHIEEKQLV